MKKQLWNLHFGNKALIFTIDAVAASIIVITILLVCYLYLFRTSSEIPSLSLLRTGDDIITILEYDGTIKTLNENTISLELNKILPVQYDMRIKIFPENITIGNQIPDDRFVASGRRFFVITNETLASNHYTQFWIWSK